MIKIFMMTSHVNCILVCNAGEMMKICTRRTWFLRGMYKVYIASRRDVFGIGLKTYDCIFFMMTSHMNCMSVCNVGETMKTCTWSTWIVWKDVLGYISSPPFQLGTSMHHWGRPGCKTSVEFSLHTFTP